MYDKTQNVSSWRTSLFFLRPENRMKRIIVCVLAVATVACSSLPSASLESQAKAEAGKILPTVMTKCGESYFLGGATGTYQMKDISVNLLKVNEVKTVDKTSGLEAEADFVVQWKMRRWTGFNSSTWDRWSSDAQPTPIFISLLKRERQVGNWRAYRTGHPGELF